MFLKHILSLKYFLLLFIINKTCAFNTDTVIKTSVIEQVDQLEYSSIIYGLVKSVKDNIYIVSNNSSECYNDLIKIKNGLERREFWALKVLDASGSVAPSFIYSNNYWLGSKDECLLLNNPTKIVLSPTIPHITNPYLINETAPLQFQYTMIYGNITTDMQIQIKYAPQDTINIGMCLPRSCDEDDIKYLLENYLDSKQLKLLNLFNSTITIHKVRKINSFTFNLFNNKLFCVISVTMLIILLIGYLQYYCYERAKTIITLSDSINKNDLNANLTNIKLNNEKQIIEKNIYEKIFNAFSLKDNFNYIFNDFGVKGDCNGNKKVIRTIAGIKSIVCFWIIILHVIYYSIFAQNKVQVLGIKLIRPFSQFSIQGALVVDAFFAMRLTPLLIVIVIISEILFNYLKQSSIYLLNDECGLSCSTKWWHNLLYIQNFYNFTDMCVSWTWYLACDMQYYIIYLTLLFIYAKHKKFAITLYLLFTIISLIVSYYFYYINGMNFLLDVLFDTMNQLYGKPWTRINPYNAGAFMGWLLYKLEQNHEKLKLNKICLSLIWLTMALSLILLMSCIGIGDTELKIVSLAFSLGKFYFGLIIGGIIVLCQMGCGGFLTKFLGHKIFLHVNKLTYGIYLLNPIIIAFIFGTKDEPTSLTDFNWIYLIFIAISVYSYLISIICSIFFELPFQKLSNEFIKGRNK